MGFDDVGNKFTFSPGRKKKPTTWQRSPFLLGWDWDRRRRSIWRSVIDQPPEMSGDYEVRGRGMPLRLRHYDRRRGWDYVPMDGDEWRGLAVKAEPKAEYRPKRGPHEA